MQINPPKLTSIIMTCFNNTRFSCHMSMEAIANITKFTNPDEYELIVMDPIAVHPIRDDYKVLKIDKHFVLKDDPGYTACMNIGAGASEGEYLVFIQNDVFVFEGWLEGLRIYLDSGQFEAVFPDQVPRGREYILETYKRDWFNPESLKGGRDAGLLMITREAFKRTGGWNEKLSILAEKDFYERMAKANVKWTDTNKVIITHVMAASNLQLLEEDPEEYDNRMRKDAEILNA